MGHQGGFHQFMFTVQHEEYQDEEKTIKDEPIFMPKFKKRKRLSRNRLREIKADLRREQSSSKPKTKKNEIRDRWSADRYYAAEQSMWQVLKAEGATFEHPITRHELRMAARKHIGDTGLLDHLLKHIEGKVAPGGTERFRRWFNTNGIMEYWLESAELDKVRQEAGVDDPYWLPPSSGAPSQDIGELKMLQMEMAQMKKDMQELIAKKKEKSEMCLMEEKQKGLVKWKAMTEKRVTEIMTSLKGVQGMHNDMLIWKSKVEQQLLEIANKLSDVQKTGEQSKQTISPPSVRWEDYLENSNLDNIHGNEPVPWFGSTEMFNISQQFVLPDPNSTLPTQPLYGELINMESGMLESAPKKLQEEQPNMTTDSSTTVNSKSDLDNSMIIFQEMFTELFTWKDKMEQQLLDVSNTVYGMLAMK